MKIEQKQPEFQPVTITLETQDELDQMFAMAYLCNFSNTAGSEDITLTICRNLSGLVLTKYRVPSREFIYLEIVK